jgi:hypothetical protein
MEGSGSVQNDYESGAGSDQIILGPDPEGPQTFESGTLVLSKMIDVFPRPGQFSLVL